MKMTEQVHILGRQGGAWVVKQDQQVRIIDVGVGSVDDFVCFNADNLDERFSQARSKANQGKLFLSTGDHLCNRDNNILFSIAEDTYGIHDLQYACAAPGCTPAWASYHGLDETFTVGGRSKPGDYIGMVARMDALCGLSACPGLGKALRVEIYQS